MVFITKEIMLINNLAVKIKDDPPVDANATEKNWKDLQYKERILNITIVS